MNTKSQPLSCQYITNTHKPPARSGHSSCIVQDSLYIFGGYTGKINMELIPMNDLWRYSLSLKKWELITTYGDIPASRWYGTLCYDSVNQQFILFGGRNHRNAYNDVFTLNLKSFQWLQIPSFQSQSCPCQRYLHSAQFKFPYLIIYGGLGPRFQLDDLWVYDVRNFTWKEVQIGRRHAQRYCHSSCLVGNTMYVFGGAYKKLALSEVQLIDFSSFFQSGKTDLLQWKRVSLKGEFPYLWGHTSSYYNGNIYVFGGGRHGEFRNDLLSINLQTGLVKNLRPNNSPAGRAAHGGGFIGSCLVIFGGYNDRSQDDLFYFNLYQPKGSNLSQKKEVQTQNFLVQSFRKDVLAPFLENHSEQYFAELQKGQFESYLLKISDKTLQQISHSIILNNFYRFNCSYDLISVTSRYFKYMLSYNQNQALQIPFECNPKVFQTFLAYLQTNILVVSAQSSCSFYKQMVQIADYFSVERLVRICEQRLSRYVSSQNYTDLLAFSIDYKLQSLQELISLQYLFQLVKSRSEKESQLMTANEYSFLSRNGQLLYNEMKFHLLHQFKEKQNHKCSGTVAQIHDKQNTQSQNIAINGSRKC